MTMLLLLSPSALVTDYLPSPGQGSVARAIMQAEQQVFLDQHALRPVPPSLDALSPPIAQIVASRWREPCEGLFEFLALQHPAELLRLIRNGKLEAADLTFAAEIAGQLKNSHAVQTTLLPLLSHTEAVVREGAIYGITRHQDAAVREKLAQLAASDRSNAVRTAAADALEEM
ncbi:HEAT repeat domain-containing protein [Chondromyces crocatus]|uniref:HEAT repeat domain-containing protein n=1 Tax=Chondromyces crocatus TaxID=52 RepID=A0A0K1ETV2_CHOCO|nr:HEAT repeat domain-containing protein [Chondromyces crocatus]AKT44062.1 uncharacterized protein CMC5_083000 [Chondromyces crocatus]